jgi:magnesium-transporting ATPase (P-type)
MLQRKQTLWMLLAVICAALTFKFSFYSGNVEVGQNGHVFLQEKAVPILSFGKDSAGAGSVLILIVTVLLLAGTLINIFNFKARKKQLWITIGLIFLSLLNIFLYWWKSGSPSFTEGSYNLGAALSLAIPVFLIFAANGIRKDEKLVKSADRLR